MFLIGIGNFIVNSGVNQGNLPRRKLRPFSERVREMKCPISFLGSNRRYCPFWLVLSLTLQVARMCDKYGGRYEEDNVALLKSDSDA